MVVKLSRGAVMLQWLDAIGGGAVRARSVRIVFVAVTVRAIFVVN